MGEFSKIIFQLFACVCLEQTDLYKIKEQYDVLTEIGSDGLSHISEFLKNRIRDNDESPDNYWKNRIQPFIKKWPKNAELFVYDQLSENLALMIIELDDAFEEALTFLLPFIKSFPDIYLFLTHLNSKKILNKKPRSVFKLLSLVFTNEYQYPAQTFRDVLKKIIKADPTIETESDYKNMNNFLLQYDL